MTDRIHESELSKDSINETVTTLIEQLTDLARRDHYYCDDSWYSCPKALGGCWNDAYGDECNCGADKHNVEVDTVSEKLIESLRSTSV